MSIPKVSGALRGWTKKRMVRIITKTYQNYIQQIRAEIVMMDIFIAPLQPEKVRRKPEEQRSWKWYDIVTKSSNRPLKIDDQVQVNGIVYSIDSVQPWDEGGYRRYEATEKYTGLDSLYSVRYNGNGSDGGTSPTEYAYQEGATVEITGNTFTRTDFTFDGWNTSADGSGDDYIAGDDITIATDDIILYAQWEAVP